MEAESVQAVNPFVSKLATGEWSADQFRQHLHDHGTPLVERVGGDEVEVTFVDEPGGDGTRVNLKLRFGYTRIEPEFTPIAGVPFQVLTLRMRSDLRFSYQFTRQARTGQEEHVPDPFNPPPTLPDEWIINSVAVLPDALPLPWLDAVEAQPDPVLETEVLASEFLGNERNIWVSLPPGEVSADSALPFVIVFDGTPRHSAPAVRDALVRAGLIQPCVVVLVDQIGLRDTELTCNPAFSRMLIEELLPRLRDRYPLSRDPGDAAVCGASFGGLCAGWTALHHSDTFGNAIIQSPSCWYHPELDALMWSDLLRRHTPPTPTLIADFLAAAPAPIRIFHETGELEQGSSQAPTWAHFGNSRWLDHVLTLKGYDTIYREIVGGHDAVWWRGTFADALQWCFPATTTPTTRTSAAEA
jgi:enterochelin esterase-like enzyme